MSAHTPGPWAVTSSTGDVHCQSRNGQSWICQGPNPSPSAPPAREIAANAILISEAPNLLAALTELADVFAYADESSIDRFERLAVMFRKDTGYLAPGKDQPMGGADQPDGDALRAIYDAWFAAKVAKARAAIAKATHS